MNVVKKIKKKVTRTHIWQRLVAQSHKENLPGFSNISLFNTLKKFKEHVVWDDLVERASAISFNSAMALPPMLLFLCSLIPVIAKFNFIVDLDLVGQLEHVITDVIPAKRNYEQVLTFINSIINKPRNGLLFLGILLALFFASNAMMGVMRSFDKNYPGFTKRKGIKKRLTALRITLIIVVLFIVCLALLIAQESVLTWMGIENEYLATALGKVRWVVIFLLVFLIISYIYRHAPSVDKKWKIITPGSVVATCLVVVCTMGFSWWVNQFGTYNKLYGSIGTIIVVLVLIFLNSLILLVGFELNASIYSLTKTREEESNAE